jgi:hypothetical protein
MIHQRVDHRVAVHRVIDRVQAELAAPTRAAAAARRAQAQVSQFSCSPRISVRQVGASS